jgi:hypothetical protein
MENWNFLLRLVKFSHVNFEQYTENFYVDLELKQCRKVTKFLNTQHYKRTLTAAERKVP